MKKQFIEKSFHDSTLQVISWANEIITEYRGQGFSLTLRQLYYQMVARDLIANKQKEYKRLGSILGDARLAGLVDWSAIEDRTREIRRNSHWSSPASVIQSAARGYAIDKWERQPRRVEVWIEKDALVGVIGPVCRELDVTHFSCRGYVSLSEMYDAGLRLGRRVSWYDQPTVILHLGDHDPSGIDMTRDIRERLSMFTGETVEVKRIALNMDQIDQYGPPPNPAKVTDSRASSYIDVFGRESWELDALPPQVLADLIRENVVALRDQELWDAAVEKQEADRQLLNQIVEDLEDNDQETA